VVFAGLHISFLFHPINYCTQQHDALSTYSFVLGWILCCRSARWRSSSPGGNGAPEVGSWWSRQVRRGRCSSRQYAGTPVNCWRWWGPGRKPVIQSN